MYHASFPRGNGARVRPCPGGWARRRHPTARLRAVRACRRAAPGCSRTVSLHAGDAPPLRRMAAAEAAGRWRTA